MLNISAEKVLSRHVKLCGQHEVRVDFNSTISSEHERYLVKCFVLLHNENGGMFDQFGGAELRGYLFLTQLCKFHLLVLVYNWGKEPELGIVSIFKQHSFFIEADIDEVDESVVGINQDYLNVVSCQSHALQLLSLVGGVL